MKSSDIEVGTTTKEVPIGLLHLDSLNPRLLGDADHTSDKSIIAYLYRSAELDELLQSISTNGYLDIEPLVVMYNDDNSGLIVLEGNRRLATLRLLREPELAIRIKRLEGINIITPSVDDESKRATFDQVSVYLVSSREQARAFLGFKHINGPKKWDSYAKAKYAAEWYKTGPHKLTDIARSIGDRHDTIKRMVFAIYVLEQAQREELFDLEDRNTGKFNFSHLYTALARSQYMKYLGLDFTWAGYDPSPDPIPQKNLSKLQKVLVWIYGSKKNDVSPVVRRQNPDIKLLGEVLVHDEGHLVLEVLCDLNAAHASTEPIDRQLTASLIRARDNIREAAGSLSAYDGQGRYLLDIAENVKVTAESVYLSMAKKYHESQVQV